MSGAIFFLEVFFSLKIISSWITFSEMERFVFVKFSEKIVLSLKSFNRIVKTGLHKSGEICQCKRFFLVKSIFSRLFLDIGQMFSELWKQIVKIVSLSVQINFARKNFFLENCSVWKRLSERGAGWERDFFLKSLEKTDFWPKIVRSVVRTGLNVSRATFWGRTRFSEKHPRNNFFSNFQHSFSFLSFFDIFIRNTSLCPDESIEENF